VAVVDEKLLQSIESYGWNELLSLRHALSNNIKEVTAKIIDIDTNRMQIVKNEIHKHRITLNTSLERTKQIRIEIQHFNSQLSAVSEKLSRSKNFLGILESRIMSEREHDLSLTVATLQNVIHNRQFKNELEKNEILSRIKEVSMKIEGIKAINAMKDQIAVYVKESEEINKTLRALYEENQSLETRVANNRATIDSLFISKRNIALERDSYLEKYNEYIRLIDKTNSRLDAIAEMRKKQHQEYGPGLPRDALFKVKEEAKKKLKTGLKLSLDELKLVYEENS